MRTNIVIADELMQNALKATGLPTKRAVVEAGLKLLIEQQQRQHSQQALLALRGQLHWEGDLEQMRQMRGSDID